MIECAVTSTKHATSTTAEMLVALLGRNPEVVVSCPPSHVFGVLSDLERLPEFAGMAVEIRNGPGHAVAVVTRSTRS